MTTRMDEAAIGHVEVLRAEKNRLIRKNNPTKRDFAIGFALDAAIALMERAAIESLSGEPDVMRKALERVKFRLHFMGWPGEPMWQAQEGGKWNPDWRYEISVIENALHGSPIENPEKPSDTKRRDEVSLSGEPVAPGPWAVWWQGSGPQRGDHVMLKDASGIGYAGEIAYLGDQHHDAAHAIVNAHNASLSLSGEPVACDVVDSAGNVVAERVTIEYADEVLREHKWSDCRKANFLCTSPTASTSDELTDAADLLAGRGEPPQEAREALAQIAAGVGALRIGSGDVRAWLKPDGSIVVLGADTGGEYIVRPEEAAPDWIPLASPTARTSGEDVVAFCESAMNGAEVMVCEIGDYVALESREWATVIYDDKKIAECYTNEDAVIVGAALRLYADAARQEGSNNG